MISHFPFLLVVFKWHHGNEGVNWHHLLSSLLSSAGAATSNRSFVVTKASLSRQNICRDKIMFVATKMFFETKVLSRQADFCHDERRVLSRQTRVCRDKDVLVLTKLLSRQKWYFWQLPLWLGRSVVNIKDETFCVCDFGSFSINKAKTKIRNVRKANLDWVIINTSRQFDRGYNL